MNLQVAGAAVAILLFAAASHFTNYGFAQSSDLSSQMQSAKAAAMTGMKTVMGNMKSGGLKAGVQSAKNVMKSSLGTAVNSTGSQAMTEVAKNNVKSQMNTAKGAAVTGMKEVKTSMKSGGLKAGVQSAKNVMKSSLEKKN